MSKCNYLKNPIFPLFVLSVIFLYSCEPKEDGPIHDPYHPLQPNLSTLVIKFEFDSLQERLDNFGNPSTLPANHQAVSTNFNSILIKMIELLKDSSEGYEDGTIIFFNTSSVGMTVNDSLWRYLSNTQAPGLYKWMRVYFYYQNFEIPCKVNGNLFDGTLLSLLDPDQVFPSYTLMDSTIYGDSLMQGGSWFLELHTSGLDTLVRGQISQGQVTMPNFLHYSWPVPQDKYVVTFPITSDMEFTRPGYKEIVISISTNNNFEWIDHSDPNYFEPFDGDSIYDFGISGIKVIQ